MYNFRRSVLFLLLGGWLAAAPLASFTAPPAAPATSDYAPVQLAVARNALAQVDEALLEGDFVMARRLAAQAALDARLAWSMTLDPQLRRQASEVMRAAELARVRAVLAAGS